MSASDQPVVAIEDIRTHVRDSYGKIAADFQPNQAASCGCGCGDSTDSTAMDRVAAMYEAADATDLPLEVTGLSLGCGDPVTLAALEPGQTVLDLGSGGGIDCFLAAKRVGDTGQVIGVDMTAAMIEKARANKAQLGATNVDFRLGEIEHLPVANATVDVIISNCVINLSPDKPQVFREAYRALRPGGKLAVSDIVTDGPLPDLVRKSIEAWAGCVAGALDVKDYVAAIQNVGFVDVDVDLTPIRPTETEVEAMLTELGLEDTESREGKIVVNVEGEVKVIDLADHDDLDPDTLKVKTFSAKVTAYKPLN